MLVLASGFALKANVVVLMPGPAGPGVFWRGIWRAPLCWCSSAACFRTRLLRHLRCSALSPPPQVLRGRTTLVDVVVQFAMGGVTVEPGAHLVLGPGTRVAGGATAGVQVAAGGCAELLGPGCEVTRCGGGDDVVPKASAGAGSVGGRERGRPGAWGRGAGAGAGAGGLEGVGFGGG